MTDGASTDLRDLGLLAPARVGSPAEAATSDAGWVQAILDAEAALARAQSRVGTIPASAADTITRLAHHGELDLPDLAARCRETANPVVGLVAAFTARVAEDDPEAAECGHAPGRRPRPAPGADRLPRGCGSSRRPRTRRPPRPRFDPRRIIVNLG